MAGNGNEAQDFVAHEHSYGRFVGLFKYGAVACFAVAAIVILIIAR